MSVLKEKRNVSTAEYVKLASDIFDETLQFISRVSNRYVRLIGPDIMHLAGEVEDNCDAANRVNPKTKGQFEYRERHLLEALGATSALDVRMSKVYRIMMKNPQGCFTDTKGETLEVSKAVQRLDNMAQSLGEKIDQEMKLIQGVLNSDRSRWPS